MLTHPVNSSIYRRKIVFKSSTRLFLHDRDNAQHNFDCGTAGNCQFNCDVICDMVEMASLFNCGMVHYGSMSRVCRPSVANVSSAAIDITATFAATMLASALL